MKRIFAALLTFATATTAVCQTQQQQAQQTARQALLEMFISGKPGALERHLPSAARKALTSGGADNDVLQKLASVGNELREGGRTKVETFDDGPILVTAQDEFPPERRLEITVERDSEQGGEDQIELSLHMYINGKPQPLPVLPRLTFTFGEEKGTWKLNDVSVLLRLPLNDPEFLMGFQQARQPAIEATAATELRILATAEVTYASAYPQRGFTCKLAELGGADQRSDGEPGEHNAQLIDSNLASGTTGGYTFSIQGCGGSPADKFQMTAVPTDQQSGMRAFCTDQAGVIRFSSDGDGTSCLNSGEPLR